ncbi:MAG: CPBP family intramembrane metalloprotease [Deltaproteobacteria bacterium]|nr:CPBP family intramembrane metalloprotease [Deltaproteobacteria bacterium]
MTDPAEQPRQPSPPERSSRRALREIALVYVAVCVTTWLLTRLRHQPPFADYVHLAVGGLFLITALKLAGRLPGGVERFGLSLGGLLEPSAEDVDEAPGPLGLFDLGRALWRALPSATREFAFALGVALLIFPPFVVGFYFWHAPSHAFHWAPPPDLGSFALAQFVVVALPEEAFFRGYLQTRLEDVFPKRRRLLGSSLSVGAWIGSAALFALIHFLVEGNPARLAVFFPGLLFGWLRARRGGIGASLTLHAGSNLLSEILVRGWL